ncbi:polysaccharide export protein [Gallaecimonas kandeliae]|uniref:polysaccharide export protein n=1 Tax=Gallaecimonas kandeliae TaxID=3029055 RepID=UPI002648A260|nr:polysaccharide export protein [Gallaecimonas kandeliae]WKE66794.1 polysaccharide export protein [Gallaecimonas kandeliae]
MKTLLFIFVFALGGCTLVPGSHLPYQADSTQVEPAVEVKAITPALLLDMQPGVARPLLDTTLKQQLSHYDYLVGSGDILNITVWDHPELTIPAGSMRSPQEAGNWVHSDGSIFYPYVGRLEVAGLKVTRIRDLIRDRLAKFIENPQVDVTVAAFRSKRVYVTGKVNKPGTLPLTNVPLTLLEAISLSGGLAESADWNAVTVTRDGKERHFSLRELYQEGNTAQNLLLQPDDIIHVARNDNAKVFVLGEVGKPQSLTLGRDGMSLAEALAEAGGFSETTANASGIFVLRKAPTGSGKVADVFQLDAANATALVLADQFRLRQRDIVYVTAAPVSRWNRVINQLLPSLNGFYSLTRVRNDLQN